MFVFASFFSPAIVTHSHIFYNLQPSELGFFDSPGRNISKSNFDVSRIRSMVLRRFLSVTCKGSHDMTSSSTSPASPLRLGSPACPRIPNFPQIRRSEAVHLPLFSGLPNPVTRSQLILMPDSRRRFSNQCIPLKRGPNPTVNPALPCEAGTKEHQVILWDRIVCVLAQGADIFLFRSQSRAELVRGLPSDCWLLFIFCLPVFSSSSPLTPPSSDFPLSYKLHKLISLRSLSVFANETQSSFHFPSHWHFRQLGNL